MLQPAVRAARWVVPRFSRHADALRSHFDERFADPRSTDGGRFVWDYWHVPGQYTALRTPAWHFFPPRLYSSIHQQLLSWGRANLGCHDLSPPWLSCYVEGCRQELHGDLPHGPFAFVLSLTPWDRRKFRGGETLLLKDSVLDLWSTLDAFRGMEENDVLEAVPARFNQLLVFDPRVPHGVRRVEGVQDPREGRLVLHGWFVQPRPYIVGPLSRSRLASLIEALGEFLGRSAEPVGSFRGTLVLRFGVTRSGKVASIRKVTSTVVASGAPQTSVARSERALMRWLSGQNLGRQRGTSEVTLPVSFDSPNA